MLPPNADLIPVTHLEPEPLDVLLQPLEYLCGGPLLGRGLLLPQAGVDAVEVALRLLQLLVLVL